MSAGEAKFNLDLHETWYAGFSRSLILRLGEKIATFKMSEKMEKFTIFTSNLINRDF